MRRNLENMVIINPNAGKGLGYRVAHRVESAFKERGWNFSTSFTYGVKHAVEITKHAVSRGYKTIVAVGGDGTINEVVNGIVGSSAKLGIVSIGTGNDYIKSINLPVDIEKSVQIITEGKTRKVDIGKVEDTYFINGLGIGFDAQVAENIFAIKRLKGFSAYLYAVIKNLLFFKNPFIEASFNSNIYKNKYLLISVMIGRCMGGGFYLAPEAEIDDGLFDVILMGDFKLFKRFWFLPKVTKGQHIGIKGVEHYRTDNLVISSMDNLKVHVDGEMVDLNPKRFEINLFKKHISVIVP